MGLQGALKNAVVVGVGAIGHGLPWSNETRQGPEVGSGRPDAQARPRELPGENALDLGFDGIGNRKLNQPVFGAFHDSAWIAAKKQG